MLKKRGVTLLEMLVVLIIIGLLTTLLMQGFAYVLQLRGRFLGQLSDLQQGTLQEHWFRSSTAALLADYPDIAEPHVFKGEIKQFQGLTIASLDADVGLPVSFSWLLLLQEGNTILQYQSSTGETWEIARWMGDSGEFSYLDSKGKWYPTWPPQSLGIKLPQLPKAIMLTGFRRDLPFTWIVQLTGQDNTPIDFRLNSNID